MMVPDAEEALCGFLDSTRAGVPAVLCTIIAARGSAPRGVGAKMCVTAKSIIGTIGGGALEHEVGKWARDVLNGKEEPGVRSFHLEEVGDGMACGGEVDVFVEISRKARTLVVCGAGHVGLEVVRLATKLEYRIVAFDRRTEAVEAAMNIGAHEAKLIEESYTDRVPDLGPNDAVVVATHAHSDDEEAAEAFLRTEAGYVGVIASKKKAAHLRKRLKESGIERERMERLHTPIGLDIGGETPAAIAVSIIAEILARSHDRLRDGRVNTMESL
jgi:xanthine dehydrogenase accessory factor